MYLQVALSCLLSSVALCLADGVVSQRVAGPAANEETTTKPVPLDAMSESAILATVAACATGSVLIVLLPTIIYHKLIRKHFCSETF